MPERDFVINILRKYNIPITGVLHIGAHKFEEAMCYACAGIPVDKVKWIEANNDMITQYSMPNWCVYNYCVTDKEGDDVSFKISNSTASSSVLNFDVH